MDTSTHSHILIKTPELLNIRPQNSQTLKLSNFRTLKL